MIIRQVAVVSDVPQVPVSVVAQVSAALQKQAVRDLSPIWEISASVNAFAALEDVPLGYWPIIVVQDVKDAAGVHLDKNGQPFALVETGPSWELTASHECLEMLVDPFGDHLIAGKSPKTNQGRVEFLVEVCDPSEAATYSYTVNGVLVSDFYTPHYFDPIKSTGVRYSYTGAIKRPRSVLKGGYLSWHDPVTDHWWQEQYFGTKRTFHDLGILTNARQGIRAAIDALTPQTKRLSYLATSTTTMKSAATMSNCCEVASDSRAKAWRTQIAALKKAAKPLKYVA